MYSGWEKSSTPKHVLLWKPQGRKKHGTRIAPGNAGARLCTEPVDGDWLELRTRELEIATRKATKNTIN